MLLAAGRSRRFGAANKLLAPLHGRPLLWYALDAAIASGARPLVVVTGHRQPAVRAALRAYRRVHQVPRLRLRRNPRYREGMAGSLQTGIAALGEDVEGALVFLGDMPAVGAALARRLIAAFEPGDEAVVPLVQGRRAHPVLLGRVLFDPILRELAGDEGARRLLARCARLRLVEADDDALVDVDTRRDWRRLRPLSPSVRRGCRAPARRRTTESVARCADRRGDRPG